MKISQVRCVAQLGTFATPIASLAVTSDGTLLAVAPEQGDVQLWDVVTGNQLSTIALPEIGVTTNQYNERGQKNVDEVYSLALSDDGLFLAASFRKSGRIYVWTFEGELVASIQGDRTHARSVCFLPNTSLLVVVFPDTQLQLWDVMSQRPRCILPGIGEKRTSLLSRVGRTYHLACAPDGSLIALSFTDLHNLVGIWTVRQEKGAVTCEDQTVFSWGEGTYYQQMQFRQPAAQLYHLTKKSIEGYDLEKQQPLAAIMEAGVLPMSFCFSPQGDMVAFADDEGMIYLWDMERSRTVFRFDSRELVTPSYLFYDRSVQAMAWLSQSNLLATAGFNSNDGSGLTTVKLWQIFLC